MGFLAEISANKSGQDGKPRLTKKEHKAIAQRTRALEELVRKQKELQGYYGCYEEATGSLPNHYKVLGIDMSADPSDVKKSYHRVALRCHPDKDALCGHAPMDKMNLVFGVVRNAYDTLSDRQRWATLDLAFFLAVHSHSNFSLSLSLFDRAAGGRGTTGSCWTRFVDSTGAGTAGPPRVAAMPTTGGAREGRGGGRRGHRTTERTATIRRTPSSCSGSQPASGASMLECLSMLNTSTHKNKRFLRRAASRSLGLTKNELL